MPTILLSVELRDQASAATRQVSQQMALLEAATAKASTGMDALEAASKRAAATLSLVAGGARDAATALDTLATSLGAASREFGALDTASRATGAALSGQVAAFTAVRDASAAATLAIRGQIDALNALAIASRTAGAAGANTVIGSPVPLRIPPRVPGSAGARLSPFDRAGRVLGTGVAAEAGLGGRVLNAALGPEGLAIGLGLYGGYKAAQASNQFYSAVAGLAAATGTPIDGVQPVARSALQAGGSGTSQFSPTQIVAQGQQFLAAGVPGQTYGQIAQYLSQGAAVLSGLPGAKGTNTFDALTSSVTDLANSFGQGKDTTAAMFRSFADMTVAADQFSKANPGAFAQNLAKMLPVAQAAGVSLPETLGFAIAETHTGESTRFSATNFARLISNVSLRTPPTPAQERAALGLGVEIGPNALKDYGGLTGFLQAVQRGAARDPNAQADLYALSGTTNAFRGISEVLRQMQSGGYQRFVAGLQTSEGTIPRSFQTLIANSPNAQLTGIANQFNTDLINAGKTLTDTFQPDLISAAKAILGAAEGAGNALGAFGHQLDSWSSQLNLPKQAQSAKSWVDQHIPGGAGTVAAVTNPAALLTAPIAAAKGIADRLPGGNAPDTSAGQGPGHWELRSAGRGGSVRVWVPDAQPQAAPTAASTASSTFFNPSRFTATTPAQAGPASATFFSPSTFTPSAAPSVPSTPPRYVPGTPYLDLGVGAAQERRLLAGADQQTTNARLAATGQASASYQRLTGDAQAVKQAQDDLSNKIAAGLPTDNVVRQLGVYSAALKQLKTDFDTFQSSSAAAYGKAVPVPGISDKTITAQGAAVRKAVGQYGYTQAKTDFDTVRQQYQAGQVGLPAFKKAEQEALDAISHMSISGAEKKYLDYSVTSQFNKATGSVQRQDKLAADQQTLSDTYGAFQYAQQANLSPAEQKKAADAYFAAERKAAADQYQGPANKAALIRADRGIDQQQALFTQGQKATADQLAVTAAQQNLDAAKMMSTVPGQWKQQEDAYFNSLRQLYRDTLKGPALQVALRGVDQQQAVATKQDYTSTAQRGLKDIQDRLQIDQNTGNLGAVARDQQAILNYLNKSVTVTTGSGKDKKTFTTTEGSLLGYDSADIAAMASGFKKELRGLITPTPPPFRQNQPGLGALQAGPGGTALRFGGGQDPQLEYLRQVLAENARLRAELAGVPGYLAQIARNTAPGTTGARGARPPQ